MTTTRTGSAALRRRLFWTASFVVGGLCLSATAGSLARERRTDATAVARAAAEPQMPPSASRVTSRRLPRIERNGWSSPDPARQAPLALVYQDANETLYSRLPNEVNSLSRRANVVWLGTRGGARRIETADDGFTPLRTRHFFQKDGLPGDDVAAVAGDADGSAWAVVTTPPEKYGQGTAHLCRFEARQNRWRTLRSLDLPRPARYPGYGSRWPYAPLVGRGVPAVAVTGRRVFFTLGVLGMPEAGPGAALLVYDKAERVWCDAAWDAATMNSDHEAPAPPPGPAPNTEATWGRFNARLRALPGGGGLPEGDLSPAYPAVNALMAAPEGGTPGGGDRVYLATSGGLLRFDIGGARSSPRWRRFRSDQAFLLAAPAPGALYLVGRPLPDPQNAPTESVTDGGGWRLSRFDTRTGEARDWLLSVDASPARQGGFSTTFDLPRAAPQSVAVTSDGAVWVTAGRNSVFITDSGTRFWVLGPGAIRPRAFEISRRNDARTVRSDTRLWERVPDDALLPLVARAAEHDFSAPMLTQEALDRFRDWFPAAPLPHALSRTWWASTNRVEETINGPGGSRRVTWTVGGPTGEAPSYFVRREEAGKAAAGDQTASPERRDPRSEQHFPIPPLRPSVTVQYPGSLAATRDAFWTTGTAYYKGDNDTGGGATGFVARLDRVEKTVRVFGSEHGLGNERTFVSQIVSDGESVWAGAFRFNPQTDRFEDVGDALAPLLPGWGRRHPIAVPGVRDLVADFGQGGSRETEPGSPGAVPARRADFVWALVSGSVIRDGQGYAGPPLPDTLALARFDMAEKTWKVFTPPLSEETPPPGGRRGNWLRVEKEAAYVATNQGVLRFDRAAQTWRTIVPPHWPRRISHQNLGGDVSRLTRDPREPGALYLINAEFVLRWKER